MTTTVTLYTISKKQFRIEAPSEQDALRQALLNNGAQDTAMYAISSPKGKRMFLDQDFITRLGVEADLGAEVLDIASLATE